MDPLSRLFVRIAYWLRHPPSRAQVYTAAIVLAACLAVVGFQYAGYWPSSWSVNAPMGLIRRD